MIRIIGYVVVYVEWCVCLFAWIVRYVEKESKNRKKGWKLEGGRLTIQNEVGWLVAPRESSCDAMQKELELARENHTLAS